MTQAKRDAAAHTAHARGEPGRRPESIVGRLLRAQEEERRRIAREVHDDIGGRITEMALVIRRVAGRAALSNKSLAEDLEKLLNKVEEAAKSVRRMSHQLHSPVLKIAGVVAGLESLCREFETSTGVSVRFTASGAFADVSGETALCVYRIAQEALTNIAKHSAAAEAGIRLERLAGRVQITINDSGVGFAPDFAQREGLGLVSMEERARLLHGEFHVQSQPGRGVCIQAILPVSPPDPSSPA